ncbi:MAG: enoyl-CoA hydratase/isomerase family protein [Arenicellales bacterium]
MNTKIGKSVLIRVTENVATVTLNRPEVVNAIDENTRSDLKEIFTNIQASDDIKAVILTGDRDNFCGGSEVTSMQDISTSLAMEQMRNVRHTAMAIAACNKPIIAAVEGHAAGAGIGLALLCDKIIASKKSKFTFSFSRIGLGPEWGLSVTLPDRIGRIRARNLLWNAQKMSARSALEIGLIDETCIPGGALDCAWVEAKMLANKAALAVQGTKFLTRIPLDELRAALDNEAVSQAACVSSEDFSNRIEVFKNRRRQKTEIE